MPFSRVLIKHRKKGGLFDRGDPWREAQGLRRTVKWRAGVPGEKTAAQGKIILTATIFEWIWMLAVGFTKTHAVLTAPVAELSLSCGPGRVAGDRAVCVSDHRGLWRKRLRLVARKLCSLQCAEPIGRRMRPDGIAKRICRQRGN